MDGSSGSVTLSRVEYDLMRLEANQLALMRALAQRGILVDEQRTAGGGGGVTTAASAGANLDLLLGCSATGCSACHRVSGYHDESGTPVRTAAGFDPRAFGLPTSDAETHALPCDFRLPAACHRNTGVPSGCVGVLWQNDSVQRAFADACERARTKLDTVCRHERRDAKNTVSIVRPASSPE